MCIKLRATQRCRGFAMRGMDNADLNGRRGAQEKSLERRWNLR